LSIGDLKQAAGAKDPLVMTLTGFKGGVGTSAVLFIDAPNGLVIPRLSEVDASIVTTAASVRIDDAFIDHTLWLQTPFLSIWDNNWSPVPVLGNGEQMFQPTKAFFLDQDFYATHTNSFVVQYGATAQVYDQLGGIYYLGASFVRDFDRQGYSGDIGSVYLWDQVSPLTGNIFPVDVFDRELEKIKHNGIRFDSGKPAVNLGPIRVHARRNADGFEISVARN
jgi:hypothetical protein